MATKKTSATKKTGVMSKIRGSVHPVAKKLRALKNRGVETVKVYYTTEVNGKTKPNYKTIAITGALISTAAAGYYAYRKHKTHGHVLYKKSKK